MSFVADLERMPSILNRRPLTDGERAAILRKQAEALIRHLYNPHPEYGWRVSSRADQFKGETIKWGNLHVVLVEPMEDGSFIATIEEASHDCTVSTLPSSNPTALSKPYRCCLVYSLTHPSHCHCDAGNEGRRSGQSGPSHTRVHADVFRFSVYNARWPNRARQAKWCLAVVYDNAYVSVYYHHRARSSRAQFGCSTNWDCVGVREYVLRSARSSYWSVCFPCDTDRRRAVTCQPDR